MSLEECKAEAQAEYSESLRLIQQRLEEAVERAGSSPQAIFFAERAYEQARDFEYKRLMERLNSCEQRYGIEPSLEPKKCIIATVFLGEDHVLLPPMRRFRDLFIPKLVMDAYYSVSVYVLRKIGKLR